MRMKTYGATPTDKTHIFAIFLRTTDLSVGENQTRRQKQSCKLKKRQFNV